MYYGLVLPGAPAREQRERIVAAATDSARALANAWRSFGRPEADLRAAASKLRCPVLVAWARSDRVIPLALVRAAIRRIPGAELEIFPGGHAPFLECPERFEPVLRRFLARAAQERVALAG
jgi:4,5:9,10-diseco-3-hydroxy-5,9,17-trioxoandrosta-1(10),2-diene-4-oate hydrolase